MPKSRITLYLLTLLVAIAVLLVLWISGPTSDRVPAPTSSVAESRAFSERAERLRQRIHDEAEAVRREREVVDPPRGKPEWLVLQLLVAAQRRDADAIFGPHAEILRSSLTSDPAELATQRDLAFEVLTRQAGDFLYELSEGIGIIVERRVQEPDGRLRLFLKTRSGPMPRPFTVAPDPAAVGALRLVRL